MRVEYSEQQELKQQPIQREASNPLLMAEIRERQEISTEEEKIAAQEKERLDTNVQQEVALDESLTTQSSAIEKIQNELAVLYEQPEHNAKIIGVLERKLVTQTYDKDCKEREIYQLQQMRVFSPITYVLEKISKLLNRAWDYLNKPEPYNPKGYLALKGGERIMIALPAFSNDMTTLPNA